VAGASGVINPIEVRDDGGGECQVYNDSNGSSYGNIWGVGCGYDNCCDGQQWNGDCPGGDNGAGYWDY